MAERLKGAARDPRLKSVAQQIDTGSHPLNTREAAQRVERRSLPPGTQQQSAMEEHGRFGAVLPGDPQESRRNRMIAASFTALFSSAPLLCPDRRYLHSGGETIERHD